jgi:hypothetical protein
MKLRADLTIPLTTILARKLRRGLSVGRRLVSLPTRTVKKYRLRSAYLQGNSGHSRRAQREAADEGIVNAGTELRESVLAANRNKYATLGFRVLMIHPGSITADVWFGGLSQCMRHAGIDCRVVLASATQAEINDQIDELAPNVVISTDTTQTLQRLDLRYLLAHKRNKGCLRLFVPIGHSAMPGGTSTPAEDRWRWSLRNRGMTADAYFSIFEADFYERFVRDPTGPEIDFITVPQACNPFVDYPRDEEKRADYFMATTLSPERLDVTYRYIRPIMQRYQGIWAGPRWGFGLNLIPVDEMPTFYARARVSLSPLVGFVQKHSAELTLRVYATAACGAFQITMPTACTHKYFEPDELIQAGSPQAYMRTFQHFVDRPQERTDVALRALRRTYSEHTCFNRIDQLVGHWRELESRGLF